MTEEEAKKDPERYLILMDTIQEGLDRLEQVPEACDFLYGEYKVEEEAALEQLKSKSAPAVVDALKEILEGMDEITFEDAQGLMKKVQKASGVKGKNLYMPARAAMTGNVHGPELSNIIYLLGKDEILARLEKAKAYM